MEERCTRERKPRAKRWLVKWGGRLVKRTTVVHLKLKRSEYDSKNAFFSCFDPLDHLRTLVFKCLKTKFHPSSLMPLLYTLLLSPTTPILQDAVNRVGERLSYNKKYKKISTKQTNMESNKMFIACIFPHLIAFL